MNIEPLCNMLESIHFHHNLSKDELQAIVSANIILRSFADLSWTAGVLSQDADITNKEGG